MANRNGGKCSSNGNGTKSPPSNSSNNNKAPECAAATKTPPHLDQSSSEFRQLVVQEQVRSLRRRLWHAFLTEDATAALRAYKATAKDLQDWVREELGEANRQQARRIEKEKEIKDAQRPTMMKRLSLATTVVPTSNKKQVSNTNTNNGDVKANRSSFRRRSSATSGSGATKESSSYFPKLKKPPPPGAAAAVEPTTNTEIDLIMAETSTDNGTALLPVHMNPSEAFQLDDYKDPTFAIDTNTGEPRSIAAMTTINTDTEHDSLNNSSSHPAQSSQTSRYFKAFRKRNKSNVVAAQQPRTPASSFWSNWNLLEGRRGGREAAAAAALAATAGDATDAVDPSESTAQLDSPSSVDNNSADGGGANGGGDNDDAQTVILTDAKMTSPLHEAARLGDAELVQLMLTQPFAEPNFKNGQKRTALHMVAGGWTEAEERLWRTRQQKMETKLNHKKKQQGGSLKTGSANAKIGISSPLPVKIEPSDAAGHEGKDSSMAGAKKAARAMGRFFNTTFSTTTTTNNNNKDGEEGSSNHQKKPPPSESQGYLVWDEQLWNKLRIERMDCLLAVMSWCHPDDGTTSAGEGASVNAVDAQGRTALHYAAELGREDACMAVLSSFGAMLTVVDEMARTPCELAAEHSHSELASQLEARALLYSDPYGMDDELLAAVMEERQLPDDIDLKIGEGENVAIEKARMSLAAPFSWYKTLSMDGVDMERKKRLAECCLGMMTFIKNKEDENELKKVMYGMQVDDNTDDDVESDGSDDSDEIDVEDSKAKQINSSTSNEVASRDEQGAGSKGGEDDASISTGNDEKLPETNDDGSGDDQASSPAISEGRVDAAQDPPANNGTADPPGGVESSEQDNDDEEASSSARKEPGQPKDDPPGEERTSAVPEAGPAAEPEEGERNLTEDELSSLKSIQTAHMFQYLSSQGWSVEDALAKYAENPLKALDDAGVPLKDTHRALQRAGAKEGEGALGDSISSSMCLICFDEFDIVNGDEWTHLVNCSHSFCNSCLGDYLVDCGKSKSTGLSVPCPHHQCVVPMAQPEIRKLTPSEEIYGMLQNTANDNFIASASDLRFCSHPGCIGVVKVSISTPMKRFGVTFDFLSCSDAVCTAVHAKMDESKIDIGNGDTPPVTYEGVVDLQLTNVRAESPPTKAHRFCFGCGDSGRHFPVACEALEEWKKKISEEVDQGKEDGDSKSDEKYEDVAQRLWMRANTRPCPKCKAPIEKNEGCNHMSCFNPQCKHEFCWICRKDWKLHNTATGGFFRCNRWQDEDKHDFYDTPPPADQMPPALSAEEAANDAVMSNPEVMAQTYGTAMHEHRIAWKTKKEMQRFLHHYTRWNAHMESAALENLMSENVCDRLAPVVGAATDFMCDTNFSFGGKGLSFVHAAFKELLECRSVLQHSYVYSFFKFESLAFKRQRHGKRAWNEKTAFEQLQSELEMITEQMSDIVARSHLRATQTQILFLTVGASERRNEISNLIFSLLKEEKRKQDTASDVKPRSIRNIASLLPIDDGVVSNSPAAAAAAAAAGSLVVQGLANEDDGEAQNDPQATETVREALMASLDEFLANTEDEPTFLAHIEVDEDDDEGGVIMGGEASDEFDEDEDDADDEEFSSWACSACTYMNTRGRHCAMCGTPPDGF